MKRKLLQQLLFFITIISLNTFEVAPVGANDRLENTTNHILTEKNSHINAGIFKVTTETLQKIELPNQIPSISKRIIENNAAKEEEWYEVYAMANINVRIEPSIDSYIYGLLEFNQNISVCNYNEEWLFCNYEGQKLYINKNYVSTNPVNYKEYSMPDNKGFKSFMSYKAITDKSSKQYLLQSNYAYTGNNGIRQINGRYCVAIGTAFNSNVGDYADLILENGEIIPIIISDVKADIHTEPNNIVTYHNGCVSEFVCDVSKLDKNVKTNGDISYANENWNSKVVTIKIYDKNVLN